MSPIESIKKSFQSMIGRTGFTLDNGPIEESKSNAYSQAEDLCLSQVSSKNNLNTLNMVTFSLGTESSMKRLLNRSDKPPISGKNLINTESSVKDPLSHSLKRTSSGEEILGKEGKVLSHALSLAIAKMKANPEEQSPAPFSLDDVSEESGFGCNPTVEPSECLL